MSSRFVRAVSVTLQSEAERTMPAGVLHSKFVIAWESTFVFKTHALIYFRDCHPAPGETQVMSYCVSLA